MKVRLDYVTNSSSSSFVIIVPKETGDSIKIKMDIDLEDIADTYYTSEILGDDKLCIDSIEELNKWFTMAYDTDPSVENIDEEYPIYSKLKAAIESGKKVFLGQGSSDDNKIKRFLYGVNVASLSSKEDDLEFIEA